jgi:hypothetical protein
VKVEGIKFHSVSIFTLKNLILFFTVFHENVHAVWDSDAKQQKQLIHLCSFSSGNYLFKEISKLLQMPTPKQEQ